MEDFTKYILKHILEKYLLEYRVCFIKIANCYSSNIIFNNEWTLI